MFVGTKERFLEVQKYSGMCSQWAVAHTKQPFRRHVEGSTATEDESG
jgi:hypothetical protein